MPNISKFNEKRAHDAITFVKGGDPLHWVAYGIGVSTRTLKYWLAAGRAGDQRYAAWVERFEEAAEIGRRQKLRLQFRKQEERSKADWPEFKKRRIRWWKEKLGLDGFYRQRMFWLAIHGHQEALIKTAIAWELERQIAPKLHDRKKAGEEDKTPGGEPPVKKSKASGRSGAPRAVRSGPTSG
jgi:hypothetical protein